MGAGEELEEVLLAVEDAFELGKFLIACAEVGTVGGRARALS